jgi:hypothetical protein
MKLSRFYYFSITILAVTCAGCGVTLQSNQYSFVKALFEPRQEVPEKNWQVTWRKRVYPVYAINHESGTYFANEQGLLARFHDWQLLDLSMPGSLGKKTAAVNKVVLDDGSISLQYVFEASAITEEHTCSPWQRELSDSISSVWNQKCVGRSQEYVNEVQVDREGQLVALTFVLVPGVEAIAINLR